MIPAILTGTSPIGNHASRQPHGDGDNAHRSDPNKYSTEAAGMKAVPDLTPFMVSPCYDAGNRENNEALPARDWAAGLFVRGAVAARVVARSVLRATVYRPSSFVYGPCPETGHGVVAHCRAQRPTSFPPASRKTSSNGIWPTAWVEQERQGS
jgi:hypothetical protein